MTPCLLCRIGVWWETLSFPGENITQTRHLRLLNQIQQIFVTSKSAALQSKRKFKRNFYQILGTPRRSFCFLRKHPQKVSNATVKGTKFLQFGDVTIVASYCALLSHGCIFYRFKLDCLIRKNSFFIRHKLSSMLH